MRDLRDALEALDAERDEKSSSELAEAMTRIEALAENANATAADEARAASETGDEDEAMHILREVVERWSGSESVGTSGSSRPFSPAYQLMETMLAKLRPSAQAIARRWMKFPSLS